MWFKKRKQGNGCDGRVYFCDARVPKWSYQHSLAGKLERLIDKSVLLRDGIGGKTVAVKMHFGSEGANRTIRPLLVSKVVDRLKKKGAKPFVTDTVRIKGVDYLRVAADNGYTHLSCHAPIVLGDGIHGIDGVPVDSGPTVGLIDVASAIYDSEYMVVLSHCKGHIQSGYGGAVKNLSMGCVAAGSRRGKDENSRGKMHSPVMDSPFKWDSEKCTRCNICVEVCPRDAVIFEHDEIKFTEECWKCGRCARVCPTGALTSTITQEKFQRGLAEVANAVIGTFENGRIIYINFLLEVVPECDCMPASDTPIVQDRGIMISGDPVAIDMASIDMINASSALPDSLAGEKAGPARETLLDRLYSIDSSRHVRELASLGAGSMRYRMIKLD